MVLLKHHKNGFEPPRVSPRPSGSAPKGRASEVKTPRKSKTVGAMCDAFYRDKWKLYVFFSQPSYINIVSLIGLDVLKLKPYTNFIQRF